MQDNPFPKSYTEDGEVVVKINVPESLEGKIKLMEELRKLIVMLTNEFNDEVRPYKNAYDKIDADLKAMVVNTQTPIRGDHVSISYISPKIEAVLDESALKRELDTLKNSNPEIASRIEACYTTKQVKTGYAMTSFKS